MASEVDSKLTSEEMINAISKNTELATQSLNHHGMPEPTSKINQHRLLQVAIELQRAKLVELMIEKGCSITGDPADPLLRTPLHTAVQMQNLDIVCLLLQHKAPLEAAEITSLTPLHQAVMVKRKDIVLLLLEHGANWRALDSQGNSVLDLAAKYSKPKTENPEGTIQIVEIFLAKGMTMNTKTLGTFLLFGIRHRSQEFVESLLLRNADLRICDENNDGVLHILIRDRVNDYAFIKKPNFLDYHNSTANEDKEEKLKADFVEWLVLKGANADLRNNDGETPLQLAFRYDQKQTVRVLLEYTRDLNARDVHGNTLLHMLTVTSPCRGASKNTAEIMEILLGKGASVNLVNRAGSTPASIAATINQKRLLRILLQHCTRLDMHNEQNKSILRVLLRNNVKNDDSEVKRTAILVRMLLEKGASADSLDETGKTLMHTAAKYKYTNILWTLLPHFTKVNACDSRNRNSILHALAETCLDPTKKDYDDIVKILLSRGARAEVKNKDGATPLQLAAKYKHKNLAETLMRHGADAKICDADGQNALHFLCQIQLPEVDRVMEREMVELFITEGCDVDARTKNQMTALHLAASSGCDGIAEALIQHGADVHAREIENLDTPLHLAARRNHQAVVEVLLRRGANVETRQRSGMAAVHLSIEHSDPRVLKTLVEYNADIQAPDGMGKTPLHHAYWYKNRAAIKNLLKLGADFRVKDYTSHSALPSALAAYDELHSELLFYFAKLEAINHPVADGNCENSSIQRFLAKCRAEISGLQEFPVDGRTSMYDILRMGLTRLSVYQRNPSFQKILDAEGFREKFPIYGDLVLAAYNRGAMRCGLIETAQVSLRYLIGVSLPESCSEQIFSHLNNKVLRDLIKAGPRLLNRKLVRVMI